MFEQGKNNVALIYRQTQSKSPCHSIGLANLRTISQQILNAENFHSYCSN